MASPPSVSVVVPAFNASSTIRRTLKALLAQDLEEPYEVIVVDDGSTDGTDDIVAAAGDRIHLERQKNRGPAEARTAGGQVAQSPVLAFTDADCVPQADWLRRGLAAIKDADLVQGQVLPDPGAERTPFERTITVRREYGLYEAANLFVKRELFDELGGFEDWLPARIGKPLAEDVWFGWRARRTGARVTFSAEATVHHAVFDRGPGPFVGERLRLVYFPAMVRRMPELRDAFLRWHYFLTPRTARFDLALLGVGAALAARRGRRRAVFAGLPLVACFPYTRMAVADSKRGGAPPGLVLAVDLAADAVGFAALVAGSLRSRAAVL